MSAIRQLAQAIDTVADTTRKLAEAIYERITKESARIDALEAQLAALTKEPHKPFKQKLKERQQ